MTLRDLLHMKVRPNENEIPQSESADPQPFMIVRSDTNTQEVISAPFNNEVPESSKRRSRFRSLSSTSADSGDKPERSERRLSSLLSLRPSLHESRRASVNLPANLPEIDDGTEEGEEKEAQWEKRATLLVQEHPKQLESLGRPRKPTMTRPISDAKGDDDIREAIRLHEAGDLGSSTAMFGRLADPDGENNALSQVLYGLALRHGWGIESDPAGAISYLSEAASNSASVESEALDSGLKTGGAAKGELVLAIFELANCFRNGWGVEKDPVAARKYYETAANLGDVDSMLEVGRCYEDGFGGKKDRFLAAKYYRIAEGKGYKGVGNSWIWKEKYDPKSPTTK